MLQDEDPYRLTLFYGYVDHGERHKSWGLLRYLAKQSVLLWAVVGDSNELLFTSEK